MKDADINSSLVIPNVAILMLAVIGFMSQPSPLVSSRPNVRSDGVPIPGESYARLWQDPLTVKAPPIEPAWCNMQPDSVGKMLLPNLQQAWKEKLEGFHDHFNAVPAKGEFRILLLPVVLPGRPGPEESEWRLRARYAVISALGRAQYVGRGPDRLQFAHIDDRNPSVPFEEFEVRSLVTDNVELHHHENNWLYDDPKGKDPGEAPGVPKAEWEQRLVVPRPYDRVFVVWITQETAMEPDIANRGEPEAWVLNRTVRSLVTTLFGPTTLDDRSGERQLMVSVPSPQGEAPAAEADLDIKVVGPDDTDHLIALLQQAGPDPSTVGGPLPFDLLSPYATGAPEVLQISVTSKPEFSGIKFDKLTAAPDCTLIRTIGTDDSLVGALLGELRNRGVDLGDRQHLVLVGEWDTVYSRGLGRSFAAQLNVARGHRLDDRAAWALNPSDTDSQAVPSFLHEFSYLRGLDGRASATDKLSDEKPKEEDSGGDPKSSATQRDPDSAEGQRQNDYLRRLEFQISTLQLQLKHRGEIRSQIGAIGVIGSDVYDKLMVFRALRHDFPGVIFFTTDLDATLMDSSELDWTRNLVVASHFGLTASPPLQGRIPPFRDGYQTALFLSVLRAAGVSDVGSRKLDVSPETIKPRLFELGRRGFVDISEPDRPPATGPAALHPDPPRKVNWRLFKPAMFGLAVTVLAAFGLWLWSAGPLTSWQCLQILFGIAWTLTFAAACAYFQHRQGKVMLALTILVLLVLYQRISGALFDDAKDRWRRGNLVSLCVFAALSLVAAGGLVYTLREISSRWQEEPFAWFGGFSIWPTEVVRLFAVAVAIVGVVASQARLQKMKKDVTEKFKLDLPTDCDDAAGWRYAFDWLVASPPVPAKNAAPQREKFWWASYCRTTTPQARLLRIAAGAGLYLLAFVFLLNVTGRPAVPARGPLSISLDFGMLSAAVVAYCYLLFHVLDATTMAAIFIDKLEDTLGKTTDLEDVSSVHIVNEICNAVSGLVYWPFSVLFMLVVSRNRLFADWDWPIVLILVFGSGLALVMAGGLFLQQRARKAKQTALDFLDRDIAKTLGADVPGSGPPRRRKLLRELHRQIEAFDGVAFQPWYQNPIFRAIMIPLGGAGTLQLIERFGGKLF